MNNQPYASPALTSDERMLAAASHFFGLWVALIIWATQKDRSRFVRFQSVQALAFYLVVWFTTFIATFCLIMVMFLVIALGMGGAIAAAESGNVEDPSLFMLLSSSSWIVMMCFFFGYGSVLWVIQLIASVKVLQGQDFRYPWLGKQVEKFLQY